VSYKVEQILEQEKQVSTGSIAHIGLFAASCRETSINRKLVYSVEKILRSRGVQTTIVDLLEYQLPLFCGDDQVPKNAHRLVHRLCEFDAVFIATPELNGSPPAILKNLIDWTSMLGTDHFTGPIYAIGSASPGPMSGIMAMQHLNFILTRLGATVIPINVGTGNAATAFNQDGGLVANPALDLAIAMADQLIKRINERKSMV
jgi:chromate reductase